MTTTLLPALLRTVARNVSRGTDDLALFETAPVTLPHSEVGAPILPVDRRPTQQEWEALNKALPDQPLHLAFAVCGDRDRAGWWGAGSPGGLERRHRDRTRRRRRAGARADRACRRRGTVASRTLRRAAPRRGRRRSCRRAAPEGVPRLRRTRPHVGGRARPRRAARPRGRRATGSDLLGVPGRQGGRRPDRRRRPARRGARGHPARGGRPAVRVGAALRRLHRTAGRRGPPVARLRPALPGARPHPDREGHRRRAGRCGGAGGTAARRAATAPELRLARAPPRRAPSGRSCRPPGWAAGSPARPCSSSRAGSVSDATYPGAGPWPPRNGAQKSSKSSNTVGTMTRGRPDVGEAGRRPQLDERLRLANENRWPSLRSAAAGSSSQATSQNVRSSCMPSA